jgi:hypothetical protein
MEQKEEKRKAKKKRLIEIILYFGLSKLRPTKQTLALVCTPSNVTKQQHTNLDTEMAS